jgi:hypothetical protein
MGPGDATSTVASGTRRNNMLRELRDFGLFVLVLATICTVGAAGVTLGARMVRALWP